MKGISLNLGEEINAACMLIYELKDYIDEGTLPTIKPTFVLIQMAIKNSSICKIIEDKFAMINVIEQPLNPQEQCKLSEATQNKEIEDPFLKDSNVFLTTLRASFYNRILCLNDEKTNDHKTIYVTPEDRVITDISHPNLVTVFSVKEREVDTEKYAMPLSNILYESNPKLTIKQKLKLVLEATMPLSVCKTIGFRPD